MYLRKEDLACCRAVPQLTQVHGISHVLGLPSLSASFVNFFFPKPAKSSFDQKGFIFQHRVCFSNSLHCHADYQLTTSRLPADYQPPPHHRYLLKMITTQLSSFLPLCFLCDVVEDIFREEREEAGWGAELAAIQSHWFGEAVGKYQKEEGY